MWLWLNNYVLLARDYPIYSTQWHPEMPSWVWWENMIINHSLEAIKMGLQIATFFVNEGRKWEAVPILPKSILTSNLCPLEKLR